jgi:hypothetical protein
MCVPFRQGALESRCLPVTPHALLPKISFAPVATATNYATLFLSIEARRLTSTDCPVPGEVVSTESRAKLTSFLIDGHSTQ